MGKQIPIVDYLVVDDGEPHLAAWESAESGALYFDRRNADAKGGGTEFRRKKLAGTGKVRSFTIVHRTVPGVPAPYVSALSISTAAAPSRRTSPTIPPDPEHVKLGMPVRLTTFVAGTDDDGTEAIAFAFEPASGKGSIMSQDNVWILGTYMTKFGRHTDKDLIDLASEAALGAHEGRRRHDPRHGRARLRQPLQRAGRRRPAAPEADRPDRHPGVQRRQRVRDRRDRDAHGAPHDQGRRGRHGSRGRRRADGQGRSARRGRQG